MSLPQNPIMRKSSFTIRQEQRAEKKRVSLTPIATSEFIKWLERNEHARGVALLCLNREDMTDEKVGQHLKGIMGHGFQGRYINWSDVVTWLKDQAAVQEEYDSETDLRRAEHGTPAYLGWDHTDEERLIIQMAAETPSKFTVGDHVIDDTGFAGTVIQIDKAEPDRVEIEYFIRKQHWTHEEYLTKTDAPPPLISVNELLQAYQSTMDLTSGAKVGDDVWNLAHEQLRKTVARLLTPYMPE
jgi:hypothetical protein